MIFLSPLLLSISLSLITLTISSSYGIKKIYLSNSRTILLAILTSIGTFISMYIGKLILYLLKPELGNIFGGILLSFIGIYFIVEYIRLEEKRSGYDTSYYFEGSLKYKNISENPRTIISDKSNHILIKECFNISIVLMLNTFFICFAASITGVSISLSVLFNFILTLVSVYLGYFNSNIYISKWFNRYSNLISGVILIIWGIVETFV
ncbi:sporulation protein [Clostridium gelidum]|uniref:Sporulation protein n=1 Tax=Clostridium gelidum TaxID=704125 RepID=A0ABM7T2A5_9CLOT|nr:manganese efflux pump [Clostridium gelidum]BCZ46056.1 sporulation protein [Clostridium gelidum]